MAVSAASVTPQTGVGYFGSASLGAGLRAGLGALANNDIAVQRLAEARQAAIDAARERIEQVDRARDLAGLADEAVEQIDATEEPDRGPFARSVLSADAVTTPVNEAPAPDAESTGRGSLLDLTV